MNAHVSMNAPLRAPGALQLRTHALTAFVLTPAAPLEDWLDVLDDWLARMPSFFVNKPIVLDLAGLEPPLRDYRDFLTALARRHIRVMGAVNAAASLVGPHLPPNIDGVVTPIPTASQKPVAEAKAVEAKAAEPKTVDTKTVDPDPAPAPAAPQAKNLVIDAPVRSGQSIVHLEGDVTIVGRVSSGAEIIAGGSVHVYGAVQGRIIAGVSGTGEARIFCSEARAELLAIGGAYRTAEDIDPNLEGRAIEVRLADGRIAIKILN